jgi:hypothetical protein
MLCPAKADISHSAALHDKGSGQSPASSSLYTARQSKCPDPSTNNERFADSKLKKLSPRIEQFGHLSGAFQVLRRTGIPFRERSIVFNALQCLFEGRYESYPLLQTQQLFVNSKNIVQLMRRSL